MKIWFDMDGTIADLYGVENWLDDLQNCRTRPYDVARPMMNFSRLARLLNQVQRKGYEIGIISWTSKGGTNTYNDRIAMAKMAWLHKHLPSVHWDVIKIVKYGTNKRNATGGGILFDDEERNRENWGLGAYTPDKIMEILRGLLR